MCKVQKDSKNGDYSLMSCISSGTYNMDGQQIDENHKIIKNGRLMFGSDFILNKGNSFEFIIQNIAVNEKTRKIELDAKTQRSARMELNKMFAHLRHAYSKPRFVSIEELEAKILKRDEAIKQEALN